ncbi:MAG: hypothetical protein HN521_04590 [Candidatus Latescibacteria bacterium]|nr:hypothetical protein [Candidatus Latescibacterota bacterium]MBT5833031.1 hypothetical protein [Candidatus Latescibacterota bacterium]
MRYWRIAGLIIYLILLLQLPKTVTPDSSAIGFVTHQNNKWARQRGNTLEAFLPIDTQKPYQEIDLGTLPKAKQTWQAPYTSDWAIAVSKP